MRALLQRATHGRVVVGGEVVGELDAAPGRPGLVVLVGVGVDDGPAQAAATARRVAQLRLLPGPDGREASLEDLLGTPLAAGALVVSQFTLHADVRRGRRPSWSAAARGDVAEPLVAAVVADLRARGLPVATGVFGADMAVELTGDGPLTVWLDTAVDGS